ncbi:MAG: YncE family protein [Formivibrio sp.]|nr:YncE family protein [Formivibrio sp.]
MTAAPFPKRDLIASTNDAKYVRVAGCDTYPEGVSPDSVDIIDATDYPPRIVASVAVDTSIVGPPQAVMITPDQKLAIVAATNRYDYINKCVILENHIQVVDLEAQPPCLISKIDIGHHPHGLVISQAGDLLLVACTDGVLVVLGIAGKTISIKQEIKLSERRLASVAITPDGTAALVTLRDDQGVAVLDIVNGRVAEVPCQRISTGVAPYAIDISNDGQWAVVGNVGLGGLISSPGISVGDQDSATLISLAQRPFRAVQHLTVPSIPEGVAISPDNRWIAVLAMDGSNLPPTNPGSHPQGQLLLFALSDKGAIEAARLPAGQAAQGVIFSADSQYILAQFNVEQQIAVYAVNNGDLQDTGTRLPVKGGPSSLRATPR